MVSPSSTRLNLMVPCVAGCDGPIWISMISPRCGSRLTDSLGRSRCDGHQQRSRDGHGFAIGSRSVDQRLASIDGVVLAQRVPLELLVHEDAAQVGMPVEADAEHVPDLALGPVGAPSTAASALGTRGSSAGTLDLDHAAARGRCSERST